MLRAGRTDWKRDRAPLLQRVDGIIFGDNPEQGIVRGSTFLHPGLRFRIDFPNAWDIQNSPAQVVAKAPGADVFMLLQSVEMPNGRDIQEIALNSMQGAGFRAVQGERTTIGGVASFIGTYQGQLEDLGAVTLRAAHIPYNNTVYMVAGLTAPEAFGQADPAFVAAIRSFRPLSVAEAADIHPNRVDLYVVRQGDTWASIAERAGGVIKPASLAIMNDAEPGSTPPVGTRIKIVVGG
jgi:predicted Zn-dependent protease